MLRIKESIFFRTSHPPIQSSKDKVSLSITSNIWKHMEEEISISAKIKEKIQLSQKEEGVQSQDNDNFWDSKDNLNCEYGENLNNSIQI